MERWLCPIFSPSVNVTPMASWSWCLRSVSKLPMLQVRGHSGCPMYQDTYAQWCLSSMWTIWWSCKSIRTAPMASTLWVLQMISLLVMITWSMNLAPSLSRLTYTSHVQSCPVLPTTVLDSSDSLTLSFQSWEDPGFHGHSNFVQAYKSACVTQSR